MGLRSMTAGDGETSYANNSRLQKVGISKTWSVLDNTLKDMFTAENGFPKCMKIADVGCASGPNTLFVVSHIMDTIKDLCERNNVNDLPELEVFLNDLPDNDFNNLFKLLPGFCQNNGNDEMKKLECYMYGAPGSFYGRLFPSKSLHFAYSSYGVHWLSQIPEGVGKTNKENIYMAVTSPPEIFEAYAKQFQRDFSKFLSLRAEEITVGGRMVLTFATRRFCDPHPKDGGIIQLFSPLAETLLHMVGQGIVKEDDLYTFNVPIYTPCLQEVEAIISGEGSFKLAEMEVVRVPWYANDNEEYDDMVFDECRSGKLVADHVRAFMEPMLVSHFGTSLDLDRVFDVYADKMTEHLSTERSLYSFVIISLTRKCINDTLRL